MPRRTMRRYQEISLLEKWASHAREESFSAFNDVAYRLHLIRMTRMAAGKGTQHITHITGHARLFRMAGRTNLLSGAI